MSGLSHYSHRRPLKICLTGGPSAGKTTVIDIVRRDFAYRTATVPEAASIIYRGGFPRLTSSEGIRAAQKAIYYTQIEMENLFESDPEIDIIFCDRGTLDHPAYWPGHPSDFYAAVRTNEMAEVSRYDLVIHLQTALPEHGYEQNHPLRRENPREALELDRRIEHTWNAHPHRVIVQSRLSFHHKIESVFDTVEGFLKSRSYEGTFKWTDRNLAQSHSPVDSPRQQNFSQV